MNDLKKFVKPYYADKDIMHDLSHIERVEFTSNKLMEAIDEEFNCEVIKHALYFHGFIYSHEDEIRAWMKNNFNDIEFIENVIKASWESQKETIPETKEGKLVHDAHMIEGGKTYLIVKSLITGSVRGQNLETTIKYIEDNVLDKGKCYFEYAQLVYEAQQVYAKTFINDLKPEINMK